MKKCESHTSEIAALQLKKVTEEKFDFRTLAVQNAVHFEICAALMWCKPSSSSTGFVNADVQLAGILDGLEQTEMQL